MMSHTASPSIGIGMLKMSSSQSSTAPIHIFNTPTNNIFTTIRVSPAD